MAKTSVAHRAHSSSRGALGQFDQLYLYAADYAMAEDDLVALLFLPRQSLRDGGDFLMISASCLEEPLGQRIGLGTKDAFKWLLDKVDIRSRGQFWGWDTFKKRTSSRFSTGRVVCHDG